MSFYFMGSKVYFQMHGIHYQVMFLFDWSFMQLRPWIAQLVEH